MSAHNIPLTLRLNARPQADLTEARRPKNGAEIEMAELRAEFAQRIAQAEKRVSDVSKENERLSSRLQQQNQEGSRTGNRVSELEIVLQKAQEEAETLARKNGGSTSNSRNFKTQKFPHYTVPISS